MQSAMPNNSIRELWQDAQLTAMLFQTQLVERSDLAVFHR